MQRSGIVIFLVAISALSFVIIQEKTLFVAPQHFPKPVYNFEQNALDSNKVMLGRILFYDPILSADNSTSCASCHSPFNAFAHTDHDLSHGIFDSIGTRNAPPLFNLAWHNTFMWDGAINHLDMQALAPISHPGEMGSNINEVIQKLSASKEYSDFFLSAFQDSVITSSKILKALSQFQLTLISANSKYDRVQLGLETFTEQEENGYLLFANNCNTCHTEPLFTNLHFENNGLPTDPTLNDPGRYAITQRDSDKRRFKVPSLRNLSYTYPYMHDGRFSTIKEVIEHYSSGIEHSPTLSAALQKPIELTSNEKVDLTSFLLTLNDKGFAFDKAHQFKSILDHAKE